MNYKYTNISSEGNPLLKSGIYRVRNIVNNKFYIGSAVYLAQRKDRHFSDLKLGRHDNDHLQRSYNKYGIENFIFEVLEYVDDLDMLLSIEQYYIDCYRTEDFKSVYNIREDASSNRGYKESDDLRKKKSERTKGEKNPNYGKIMTDEYKKHMSEVTKGTWVGSKNPGAKLTEEDVIEIKKMFKEGYKGCEISKKFNVCTAAISLIKNGKAWKHVE
jgi:group I intron endonuclease